MSSPHFCCFVPGGTVPVSHWLQGRVGRRAGLKLWGIEPLFLGLPALGPVHYTASRENEDNHEILGQNFTLLPVPRVCG